MNTCVAVLLLVQLLTVYAATDVTLLGENDTWTIEGSPYQVKNTITLAPNRTLTIHAGVVVEFACDVYLIINDANIVTNGTSENPIIFTSSRASVTCRWAGLQLINLTPTSAPGGEVSLRGIIFAHVGLPGGSVIHAQLNDTVSNNVALTLQNITISQNIMRRTTPVTVLVPNLYIVGCTFTPGKNQ
jgi:hypothetical protein